MALKLIGFCEGAAVYAAEHIITVREHGGSIDVEIAKSIRKYAKNSGETPVVVLTNEQLAQAEKQGLEALQRYEKEAKKAAELDRPMPEPLPEPALSPATAEEQASAAADLEPSSSE